MTEYIRFAGFVLASMAIFVLGKDVLLNWRKDETIESVKDDKRTQEFDDKPEPTNELASLNGINPDMLPLLAAIKISTFSDLELADEDDVKRAIEKQFPGVTLSEIKLWIRQASLAEQERWDELDRLKDAMQKARAKHM
ncbi:hypothetical protein KC878_02085 [Candidatus Saccharibacteria bacterium]|nr:hypothetical protein [Candidatus Saccharibacteria bacterium]MCB9820940.1 hypothetical protein [Candidatus Nomurabacteria bacterium]